MRVRIPPAGAFLRSAAKETGLKNSVAAISAITGYMRLSAWAAGILLILEIPENLAAILPRALLPLESDWSSFDV